jgi:predicted lipoprotein with Yx(FWY)xxD motif
MGISMNKRLIITLATVGIAVTTLAGCAATGTGSSAGSSGSNAAPAATGSTLATGKTSLGTIVVNAKGDTVYTFDNDTANSGKSSCYTGCASIWPALTTTSAHPSIKGVTGTVGTITRTDGKKQVTLNGMPLYTYATDAKPGDVGGQGFMNIWYVVDPSGKQVTKAPSSSSSTGSSGGSSGAGGAWS